MAQNKVALVRGETRYLAKGFLCLKQYAVYRRKEKTRALKAKVFRGHELLRRGMRGLELHIEGRRQ